MEKILYLNLRLFGEEGAAAPAGEAPANADPAKVVYGKQAAEETPVTESTDEARRAEFERLIKEDYKDLYDERAQQMINKRFKEVKGLEARSETLKKLEPLMDMLSKKYGVEAGDAEALVKAIEEDDSYYEQEAYEKNLTVDQLKYIKQIERENEQFKRAEAQVERQQLADRQYRQWIGEAEQMKDIYPGFDLEAEVRGENGERFLGLLTSNAGLSVRDAYELIHRDDIRSGAMQLTAQTVRDKVVNDIRARGARPAEAGARPQASSVIVKSDPSKFTKADREEISRRVLRGERIEF